MHFSKIFDLFPSLERKPKDFKGFNNFLGFFEVWTKSDLSSPVQHVLKEYFGGFKTFLTGATESIGLINLFIKSEYAVFTQAYFK